MTMSIATNVVAQVLNSGRRLSLLLVACGCLTTYAADGATQTGPNAFAIEHRREVFDELMPGVSRYSQSDDEVGFSIRAEGFEDRFEWVLYLKKPSTGNPIGKLVMTSGEPLVVQLTRLHSQGLSLEDARKRIKLIVKDMSPEATMKLFHVLASTSIPIQPQVGFFLHQQRFEIAAAGWSELRFDFYEEQSGNSQIRKLSAAIWEALRSANVDRSAIRFKVDHSNE